MKTIPTWAAVVALGAAVTTTTSAFGQADLQLRQAREREAAQKKEQRAEQRENRQERQADQRQNRQERQQQRREREQLDNMPNPVKRTLRAETEGASNIDYFRVPSENKDAPPQFGATFTKAQDGHHYDIRVDRQGNVIERTDITALHAAQAAAQAPGQAPATPAPAPAPAPAPGTAQAPTPAPAPTAPTARGEAPKSGDPIYRRLQANEVPANIRTVLDREAQGGTDVKYYRSKYGQQMAYTVRFDKGGDEQAVHVADDGNVLARGGKEVDDDSAQTAGASQPGNQPANDNAIQTGRVELNAMPQQAQTQIRRLSEGGTDVKYYATKYGNQQAYQASFTKNGQEQRVIVDANGKVLSQR